jgi:hypothetical protein
MVFTKLQTEPWQQCQGSAPAKARTLKTPPSLAGLVILLHPATASDQPSFIRLCSRMSAIASRKLSKHSSREAP